MNIDVDLIRRIISSDDLCDKVNSSENRIAYKEQIKRYVLGLVDDVIKNKSVSNMNFIIRYIRKFVIDNNVSKEDKFFDDVVLKLYSSKINSVEFNNILKELNFFEIKELLFKKYDQVINNNINVDSEFFIKIFKFYCYVCTNCVLPNNYVDYFVFNIVRKKIRLSYEMMVYFYKTFALSYASNKLDNVSFVVEDSMIHNDPYYDFEKNKLMVYKQSVGNTIDYSVLADIFYQIKYLTLIYEINNNRYSFDGLRLVKELSLITILGKNYFFNNYDSISFTNELKKESYKVLCDYLCSLGIVVSDNYLGDFNTDIIVDGSSDRVISVDILFDQVIKRENNNLIKELVRNYPVLGCEYKNGKKKTLLELLMDIYGNKKLLVNLKRDLDWHTSRNSDDNVVTSNKIQKLKVKISICESYIDVMNSIINDGDMSSDDIIKSISSLISCDTNDSAIRNNICLILDVVIPKKIERLCLGSDSSYINDFKKKVISCYLEAMNKRRDVNTEYFMKIYSSLGRNINSFGDNIKVA